MLTQLQTADHGGVSDFITMTRSQESAYNKEQCLKINLKDQTMVTCLTKIYSYQQTRPVLMVNGLPFGMENIEVE